MGILAVSINMLLKTTVANNINREMKRGVEKGCTQGPLSYKHTCLIPPSPFGQP